MPTKVATGQQTVYDINDIPSGTTAPTNPTVGMMWLNKNDWNVYTYNGTAWVLASPEYQMSGRNLLRNSGKTITNNLYPIGVYTLTSAIQENESVTVSIKGLLGAGKTSFGLYNSGGNVTVANLTASDRGSDGIYRKTFNWKIGGSTNSALHVYPMPSTVSINSTVEWIVLEKGNIKRNDWVPAPEDASDKLEEITATLGNMANDNILDFKERQLVKDKLIDILGYALADSAVNLPLPLALDDSNSGFRGSFYTTRASAMNAGILPTDGIYSAVATQYTNLKTYLESLTPIKPWDCTLANNTKIVSVVKATFVDKFLQFYKALNALASYTAQKLKENVDNVKVGGRNFGSNGDFSVPLTKSRWSTAYVGTVKEIVDISTETPPHKFAYHVKNTTAINGGILPIAVWSGSVAEAIVNKLVNQEITVSFWIKYQNIVQGASSSNAGRFGEIILEGKTSANASVYTYLNSTSTANITGTNMTWQKITKTFKLTLPATAEKISSIQFKSLLEGCTGEFWTTGIMIEGGNKASEWNTNPDDIETRMGDVEFKITPDGVFTQVSQSDLFNATLDESQGDYMFENGATLWRQSIDLVSPVSGVTVIGGASSTGKNVIQITGEKTLFYGRRIPINTNRIYRIRFSVKQVTDPTTAGKSLVYAGVSAYNANKASLTTSTFGTHRYCAVAGMSITASQGWQTFEGIISGEGNDGHNQFITGTKYVTPMFLVNSSGGNGVVQVDLCDIEDITDSQILASKIQSVEQSITPSGITTVIKDSMFYGEFTNALDSKASTSDIAENYPTKEDLNQKVDNIDISGKVDEIVDNPDSKLAKTYSTKLEMEETARGITEKFSATGGMNMVKNSIGMSGFDFWSTSPEVFTGILESITDDTLVALGFSSGIKLNTSTSAKNIYQDISVIPMKVYTLSWYINKTNISTTIDGDINIEVIEDGVDEEGKTIEVSLLKKNYLFNYETLGYEPDFGTFTPSRNKIRIRISGGKDAVAVVTGIMMTIGDVALQWSQASGESYNTNVRSDINGIRVSQLEVDEITGVKIEKGFTRISPEEFAGYYDITGDGIPDKVFWLNGDELVARRVNAETEFTMGDVKIINNNGKWAFIPFKR